MGAHRRLRSPEALRLLHAKVAIRNKPHLVPVVAQNEISLGCLGWGVDSEDIVRKLLRESVFERQRARSVFALHLFDPYPDFFIQRDTHSDLFPSTGIGVAFSICARCTRLLPRYSTSLFTYSSSWATSTKSSCPPAGPTQYASALGGMVAPICIR